MGSAKYDIADNIHFQSSARFAQSLTRTFLAGTNASFGWEATVVTPAVTGRTAPGPSTRLIETEDRDTARRLKQLFGLQPDAALKDLAAGGEAAPPAARAGRSAAIELVKALIAFPDAHRAWASLAAEAAAGAAAGAERGQPYDALLATSPPHSVHLGAARAARATGLPWVADLRDLWSTDRNSVAPAWRKRLDARLERKTFATASALVTVSEPLAAELRTLYPSIPAHAIPNGFDPALRGLAAGPSRDFVLTHTGTFYQGRRDPSLLFDALAALLAAGKLPRERVKVRLYARHEPWVAAMAEARGLAGVVEILPWAPREEALRAQQESQGLLLLHWGGEREAGVFTGKIFEYLAARRPILLIGGGEGVLADLLRETGAGVRATTQQELEAALMDWWSEYSREGAVRWRGDDAAVDRYSQVRMAERFAKVLGEAAGRG
jgi:glycosyltransferase involved in cell wall biosynthesis